MNKKKLLLFMLLMMGAFLVSLFVHPVAAADDFPYREKFGVPYIETADLAGEYDDVIIVDVRSQFEFDVVHVKKAVHVPMANIMFVKALEEIRGKSDSKKMAFYCNGHTCKKSYKAVKRAIDAGFENVYAYDAGIFDWIKAYPEKGVLMGASPVPQDKIIPKSDLEDKFLAYEEFRAKGNLADSAVVDIRDPMQREKKLDIKRVRNIPLDRIDKVLQDGIFKDKLLLIFDAVGKQVRWLQYHLEANGYTNYYFLNKGVRGKGGIK